MEVQGQLLQRAVKTLKQIKRVRRGEGKQKRCRALRDLGRGNKDKRDHEKGECKQERSISCTAERPL